MTTFTHLRLQDYIKMPWKNGKGHTFEIAKNTVNSPNERFNWRVSMASIDTDGPFSLFDGYQRYISVLDGQGIQLTIDKEDKGKLYPFDAFHFNGNSQTECSLLAESVKDFNLIYDPEHFRCSFRWLRLTSPHLLHSNAATILLFSAGKCAVQFSYNDTPLMQYESLIVDNPDAKTLYLTLYPAKEEQTACYCCVLEMTPR